MRVHKCRECGADIVWYRNKQTRKWMALEPERGAGPWLVCFGFVQYYPRSPNGLRTHWGHCGGKFKREPKKDSRQASLPL